MVAKTSSATTQAKAGSAIRYGSSSRRKTGRREKSYQTTSPKDTFHDDRVHGRYSTEQAAAFAWLMKTVKKPLTDAAHTVATVHPSEPPTVANVASVAGPSFSAPICAASTELSRRCPDMAAVVGTSRSGARCEHDAIVAVLLDELLGHRFRNAMLLREVVDLVAFRRKRERYCRRVIGAALQIRSK